MGCEVGLVDRGDGETMALIQQVWSVGVGEVELIIEINGARHDFLGKRVGGLEGQAAYTFSKNIMSRGVDFNNQFDFTNTHAPYLLDQRHRLSIAAIYESDFASHLSSGFLRAALSHCAISTTMQFASGLPDAAQLGVRP